MTHIFAKHHWKASHPRNKKQKGTLRSAVCVGASTEGGARAWGGRLSRNPAEGPKGRRAALPNGGGGGCDAPEIGAVPPSFFYFMQTQ